MLRHVEKLCPNRPSGTTVEIAALLAQPSLGLIDKLVEGLGALLASEGLAKKKALIDAPRKSKVV